MAESKLFSKYGGINQSVDAVDISPRTFLTLDNFIVNQRIGEARKRPGTYHWSVTGDIWGVGAYSKETSFTKLPVYDIPVRHRRDGSTSVIEKLNWSTLVWDTITQGTYVSTFLGVSDVWSTAQIGTLLAVCSGRPAKLTSDSGNLERLGGPAPTTAPTVGNSGTGLTGSYSFVYTFYDSTTGWESSPSPASSAVTITNKQLDLSALETTYAREGIDKKRIYRTLRTGEAPYLYDGEVAIATTTYSTTVADGSLGATAPDSGDHNPPPTTSHLVAAHENRLWISDGGKSLYYSHPYDGNNYQLEYFSSERRIDLPARITGLVVTASSGLQVFLPPGFGVYEVEGRSESQFSLRKRFDEIGTNFHDSVSTHEDFIAFWGATGPMVITPSGVLRDFSRAIEPTLRSLLVAEYGTSVFVWSRWSDYLKQFVFGFSATDATAAQWLETETGVPVNWMDVDTGATIGWVDNP